jgi:hypothetical protein
MPLIGHLASIYARAKLVLWVEDRLTRDYLDAVWASPDVELMVAGQRDAVAAVTRDARLDVENVFGLQDRDFDRSNLADFATRPERTVVRLTRFEIENYLLEPDALSAVSAGRRPPDEVTRRLNDLAKPLVPWVACCAVLQAIGRDLTNGCPSKPPQPSGVNSVASTDDAEKYILGRAWLADAARQVDQWRAGRAVRDALEMEERRLAESLSTGRLTEVMPGKQLLGAVASWLWSDFRRDRQDEVVRAVADWQRTNHAIPTDLLDLRQALRARVGLGP